MKVITPSHSPTVDVGVGCCGFVGLELGSSVSPPSTVVVGVSVGENVGIVWRYRSSEETSSLILMLLLADSRIRDVTLASLSTAAAV